MDLDNGSSATYDPRRLRGVNVYRETTREFATGDRIQFTAPDKNLGVANRDLGTVISLEDGKIAVRLDGKEGRAVTFDPNEYRQFDHGYAVTSHSSQGLTAGRVIVNIDTDSARSLINTRLAYVSISRASDDARVYTNNAETLGERLATDITKTAAVDFRPPSPTEQAREAVQAFRANEPGKATDILQEQGRVYEYANPDSRLAAVAIDYAARPDRTVIVAPDAADRQELTQLIRADLQAQGRIAEESHSVPILVEQDLSNKKLAANYQPGDEIHYKTGSPNAEGIPNNSAATVLSEDGNKNILTVETREGEQVSYNPAAQKADRRKHRLSRGDPRATTSNRQLPTRNQLPMRHFRVSKLLLCLVAPVLHAATPIKVPLTADHWQPVQDVNNPDKTDVRFIGHEGFPQGAIVLKNGSVALNGLSFGDGTIEFDMKATAQDIPGIQFRLHGEPGHQDAEEFYLRSLPECRASNDCIQYVPVIHGFMLWNVYPQYQTQAPILDGWNHYKLVVSGRRMNVYINRAPQPILAVGNLESSSTEGLIQLRGPAVFANLTITPGAVEGLSPQPTPDPAAGDAGMVRQWQLGPQTSVRPGQDPAFSEAPSGSDWKPVTADHSGLIISTASTSSSSNQQRSPGSGPQSTRQPCRTNSSSSAGSATPGSSSTGNLSPRGKTTTTLTANAANPMADSRSKMAASAFPCKKVSTRSPWCSTTPSTKTPKSPITTDGELSCALKTPKVSICPTHKNPDMPGTVEQPCEV